MNRYKSGNFKFIGIILVLSIPLIALTALYISRNLITPNDNFFVISKGETPQINENAWILVIDGQVNNTLTFTYSNFTSQPSKKVLGTLQCVEGPSGTAIWKGIPLKSLLDMAQINKDALDVIFYAADDYTSSLTVEEATEENVLLAYEMNGEPLPPEHGFPVRVVAPNQLGYKWVKWVVRIEIVNYDYKGYWESRGWSDNATRMALSGWSLHAFLLAISFLFGGIAMISGLKNSPITEFFHDLPKFINKKFHIAFSLLYFLTFLSSFIYWMNSTILNRGAIFYTLHGIFALLSVIFIIPGFITGFIKTKKRNQRNRTWHYKLNIISFVFLLVTILLGFYLAFTGQFRFL
ncbi:MAG: molybdopterin-dependent oxidoreductase [Promethearchaeota archaeon]